MALPTTISAATRRLNPHLFGASPILPRNNAPESGAKPRLKQNRGPKENKTEAAFAAHLRTHYPDAQIEREGITLLLANGLRYTPDYTVFHPDGRVVLWEVKGYMRDDAAAKIKMAAAKFPRLAFWLVSAKDRTLTGWNIERVMP